MVRPPGSRRPARRSTCAASRARLVAVAIGASVAAMLAVGAPAQAGTYDVISCKTASGVPTSTAGWSSSSTLLYDEPGNDCGLGGELSATFSATGGAVSGGLAARWTFRAPTGTIIKTAVLDRAAAARKAGGDKGATARAAIYRDAFIDDAAHLLQDCAATDDGCAAPKRGALNVNGKLLGVSAGCSGESGVSLCAAGDRSRARIAIGSARLTLQDTTPPEPMVSGKIIEDGPVRGRTSLRLDATDIGSGVREAEVRLGAKVVFKRQTLSTYNGRCQTIPGSKAFAWPVPCPRTLAKSVAFSTKGVKDGSQLLSVTVWDAAGNATVAATNPVLVDNGHHVQSDGTILMPKIAATTDELDGAVMGTRGAQVTSGPARRPASLGTNPQLQRIVTAMNTLADAEIAYCYGGGHGTTPAVPSTGSYCWQGSPAQRVTDSGAVGFDCSSSVSWVLQQAGYDLQTSTSSVLARTGAAGPGQLLTIWANAGHVYLEVVIDGQSYYWGTASANRQHGPGWHAPRSPEGFTARHIPGL